ncbi:MAG: toll/interleukin-1 receptor domain-containing protein [Chloroflexota bacterium]
MKYVEWVDRVWKAVAAYADVHDDAALYGVQIMQLPEALGFGSAASQPGFVSAGGLWEAIHDALDDLQQMGLVHDKQQWHVKVHREHLKAKDASLSTGWHTLFSEVDLSGPEMELLRYATQSGVGVAEDDQWARRLWLESGPVLEALGWDIDATKLRRLMDNMTSQGVLGGRGYGGGTWKFHPTYVGIVIATEKARFEKTPVSADAPACFISYAHEDARLARDIAYGLQAADLDIEIDEVSLAGGDSLVEWVAEATKRVEFVIALVSRHSATSSWCKYELSLGMTDELLGPGVKVIPVKVDDVEMPALLRNKLYRSVAALGTGGVIAALVSDIEKHRLRSEAAARP